jgi:hypothetical protein
MDVGYAIVTLMVAGLYFLAWLDGLSKKMNEMIISEVTFS